MYNKIQFLIMSQMIIFTVILGVVLYSTPRVLKLVNKALKLNKRHWNKRTIKYYVRILLLGSKTYNIKVEDMLAIQFLESKMKTKAWNENKSKHHYSQDFGLSQINSKNLKLLSKRSIKLLKKNKIWHTKNIKYDIAISTLNGFGYLNDSRKSILKSKDRSFKRWIVSYNTGIRGSISKKRKFKIARIRYWNKFVEARKKLRI